VADSATGSRSTAGGSATARGHSKVGGLRDFQRSRVYDAEHLVHRIFDRSVEYPVVEVAGSHVTLPVERRFGSIEAVASYATQVLALGWVRATWVRASSPVLVRERAGAAQAHYQRAGSIMAVPGYRAGSGWALRELVILHELAHHLADGIEIAHGGAFVDRLLMLVDGVVGPEAALLLRVTMLDVGVAIG
jgi:putative metallohydrolase (TIGR04338 family)